MKHQRSSAPTCSPRLLQNRFKTALRSWDEKIACRIHGFLFGRPLESEPFPCYADDVPNEEPPTQLRGSHDLIVSAKHQKPERVGWSRAAENL